MKVAFWVSTALVVYTYALYPCILLAMAGFHQLLRDLSFALRRGERRCLGPTDLPSVSLVFSAFNEESIIRQKMDNSAALNYPASRLEILIGCDGCSDQTAGLAVDAQLSNARIFEFTKRRGKPEVINELVTHAQGDIVVFSDANTMISQDAILRLVRHFQDPRVGCASGELTFIAAADGTCTEGVYWRYEVLLKFLESRLNIMVGANGGIYAIRRPLFSPIPNRGIIDDFIVSMSVRQRGFRLVYDPEAIAIEQAAASVGDEFRRRVRIGAGNFYALRYTWRLLSPTAGLVALAYWSHKVIRWLVPFALLVALGSAVSLTAEPLYAVSLIAAFTFAGMALVGFRRERTGHSPGLFAVPYYFLSMNLALALGFVRCVSGTQQAAWLRTPRDQSRDCAKNS